MYCGREVVKAKWYDYWCLFPFGIFFAVVKGAYYKHKCGVFNHNCKALFLTESIIEDKI